MFKKIKIWPIWKLNKTVHALKTFYLWKKFFQYSSFTDFQTEIQDYYMLF